ncbi:MAG: outer membrane beta-barrel protein, partial [Candidatus Thorarchaeota archaeon]|nr:outer membrane beta-barrel protein [Candidatus Thorarchaeota archaeon]NIW12441.1 outer membrane beta-barrel protein [Candidatus Thorarchaeota archaeon]
EDIDRDDTYNIARTLLTYQPLKWLFFSFDYSFAKRDSSEPLESFTRNRVFFRITFQYDVAEQFQ